MNDHDYLVALIGQTAYDNMRQLEKERDARLVAALKEPRPTAAPEGSSGAGNWPEDFSHENGNYTCECCQCGRQFMGHKRRVTCKVCATKPTAAAAVPAVGDAVAWRYRYRLVATHKWSKWEFIDEHGNAKLRRMLRDELTTPVLCEVESLYRAPAPMGGVTEAWAIELAEQLERWVNSGTMCDVTLRANMHRWAKHLRATPPAAQAQDAGPRDAERYRYLRNRNHCIVYARVPCEGWGSDNMSHVRYDTPEELDAAIDSALAAKEAK